MSRTLDVAFRFQIVPTCLIRVKDAVVGTGRELLNDPQVIACIWVLLAPKPKIPTGSGIGVGVGVGVAIGVATDNLAPWIALGVALGAALDVTYRKGK